MFALSGVNALETEFASQEQRDRVSLLQLDISDIYSISDAVKQVERNYDSIDILVNNAGINLSTRPLDSVRKMVNETLSTNYYGTVEFTQAMLPLMTTHLNCKNESLSSYFSRIITISNRDAALSKLSNELQRQFLREDLDEAALNALMEQYKKDAIKYKDEQCNVEQLQMKEGWIKCPYLMSYVGLNMFCRILGEKFSKEKDNDHWITAYCPGHCATDSTDYFGARDVNEGAFGVTTLSTMVLDADEEEKKKKAILLEADSAGSTSSMPNGTFCAAFYKNDDLGSIELEIMNWVHPKDTMSWDTLCDANWIDD